MKKIIFHIFPLILFVFFLLPAFSQMESIDSLKKVLQTEKEDTNKVNAFLQLCYIQGKPDSAIFYANQALFLSQKINYQKGEAESFYSMGFNLSLNDEVTAFEDFQKALAIFRKLGDNVGILKSLNIYSTLYEEQKNFRKALDLELEAEKIGLKLDDSSYIMMVKGSIGETYHKFGKLDSSEIYLRKAYELGVKLNAVWAIAFNLRNMGDLLLDEGRDKEAATYLYESMNFYRNQNEPGLIGQVYIDLAKLSKKNGNTDSAFYYAKKSFATTEHNADSLTGVMESAKVLSQLYEEENNYQEALRYYKISVLKKDSLSSQDKIQNLLNFTFREKENEQQSITAREEFQNRLLLYISFAIMFIILVIALLLNRSNKQQKKASIKIETAYQELKSTQSQLIQSEKMASLGELTAGIAHEIQNPLNFVNNFSDVNKELLTEMNEGIDNGNFTEVKAISKDVIDNEEKINYHGKRADAIVKGMLQHSRSSTGVKETTNINALADEYLRLSYHGLRAKDKDFNATMKTDFDNSIGKINIIPQDIGRVLLNLYNNAFYAVNERFKAKGLGYEPTVSVSTRKTGNQVSISVRDNGNGIPQKIVDKIFQPFFTTKPTGQGTGLGLSLSYDIVKAHGGEIKAETKEGEGAAFIIQLPVA
jgi:two-component system, NtrC family, sensor kinase